MEAPPDTRHTPNRKWGRAPEKAAQLRPQQFALIHTAGRPRVLSSHSHTTQAPHAVPCAQGVRPKGPTGPGTKPARRAQLPGCPFPPLSWRSGQGSRATPHALLYLAPTDWNRPELTPARASTWPRAPAPLGGTTAVWKARSQGGSEHLRVHTLSRRRGAGLGWPSVPQQLQAGPRATAARAGPPAPKAHPLHAAQWRCSPSPGPFPPPGAFPSPDCRPADICSL